MEYQQILEEQFNNVMEGEDVSGITGDMSDLTEGISDPFTFLLKTYSPPLQTAAAYLMTRPSSKI